MARWEENIYEPLIDVLCNFNSIMQGGCSLYCCEMTLRGSFSHQLLQQRSHMVAFHLPWIACH